MELGEDFYMKVEGKRKIYNFAEGTKAKKLADRAQINGIVMAAETLAAANPSLSPKNSTQLQSASKAPELSRGMF